MNHKLSLWMCKKIKKYIPMDEETQESLMKFIKSRLGEMFPVVGESPKQRASDTIICTTHILNSDVPEFDD